MAPLYLSIENHSLGEWFSIDKKEQLKISCSSHLTGVLESTLNTKYQ